MKSPTHDSDVLVAAMIDASNKLQDTPQVGHLQTLLFIAGSGFAIASAIRDLADAVREGKAS